MEDCHLWIALCVLMIAAISQASQDISAHTGENLTIPCPVQVDSDLRILYWRKNGKTIYFSGENSNGTYSVTDTTSLVISDVSDRDAGNYSCKVVRQSLETAESDVIKVYVTDLTVSQCSSSQQGSVDDCNCHVDGTDVTSLVCTASGFPHSPAITWMHNGQTVGFSSTDLKQFQDNVTLICSAWDRNVATVSAQKTVCIFYKPAKPAKPAIPGYAIVLIILALLALITFVIVVVLVWYKHKKGQSFHLPKRCPFSSCSGFSKVDKSLAQNGEDGNKAATEELLLGNSHQNQTPGKCHPDKPPQTEAVINNETSFVAIDHLLENSVQNEFDKSHAQNGEDGNKATTEELLPGNSHENKTPGKCHPGKPPQTEAVINNENSFEASDHLLENSVQNELDKSHAQNGEDGNKATTEELLPGNSHQNKFDKSHAQNGEDGNKAATEELLPGNSHENKSPGRNHPDKPPQTEEVIDNETNLETGDDLTDVIQNESTGGKEDVKFEQVQQGMNMMKKDKDDTDFLDISKDCNNDVKAWKEAEMASPMVERDPVDDMPLVGRVLLDDLRASNEESKVALKRAIDWLMKRRVQLYKKYQPKINASGIKSSVRSMNQSMQGSIIKDSSGDRDATYVAWVLKQLDRILVPADRDECEILITKPDFQEMTDESQIPEYTGKIITVSIGGNPAMSSTFNSSMPERNPLSDHILAELQSKSPQERTAARNAISQIILEFIRKEIENNSMINSSMEGFVHSNSLLPSHEDLPDEDSRLVALWTSKIANVDDDVEFSINEYLHTPKSSIPKESSAGLKEEGSNETLKSPSMENLPKDSNERVQID